MGYVYLVGDWNSRVGKQKDYIDFDMNNSFLHDEDYVPDVASSRASMDSVYNHFGHALLNICRSTNLRIVNGRLFPDRNNGTFTYASNQGASLIDMLLARETDFSLLSDFQVNPFTEFSDHASISFSLCCKNLNVLECEQNNDVNFLWNPNQKTTFRNRLIALLPKFNSITSTVNHCSRSSINNMVSQFSDTLTEVAFPLFSKRKNR